MLLAPAEQLFRLGLVGVCLFFAWASGLSVRQLGLIAPQPLQSIGLGVGVGLLTQLFIYVGGEWAVRRFGSHIYSPVVIRNVLPRHRGEWLPVALAFLPAVAMEELLFRTLWLGCFELIIPLIWLIIITSVIFGIMHLAQGPLGVVGAGSINILFCLLFIWTGELLVTLAAHYVFNMGQLVLAYYGLVDIYSEES